MVPNPFKYYLLIVVCGLLAISSAAAMVGDVISYRAFAQERNWARGRPVQNLAQWNSVSLQARTALKLAPGNSEYLFLLGRLGIWRLYVENEVDADVDVTPSVERAYAAFSQALQQRPYWGVGWSELAFMKSQLEEIDEEFEFALYAAIATGPFETKAILNLLKATFGEWDALSPTMQKETADLFALSQELPYKAHVNLPAESLDLAKGYEVLPQLCALLVGDLLDESEGSLPDQVEGDLSNEVKGPSYSFCAAGTKAG